MTSHELARVVAREGIDPGALTRLCVSPDGLHYVLPIPQSTAGAVWPRLRDVVSRQRFLASADP